MKPEDVPAEIFQRFITADFEAPDSPLGVVGVRHGLAAVLPQVESMVRADIASKVKHPMVAEDIPTGLVDMGVTVFDDQAHENCGDEPCPGNTRPYHETLMREALAEILPEYEQMVRERVAQELLAVDPVEWALAGQNAGLDAARIARGGAR